MTAHEDAQAEESDWVVTYALLAGPVRALGLLKRVPKLLVARGWPDDPDLVAVLCAACGLMKLHGGRQVFRRPVAAGGCGGKWPEDEPRLTARQIVDKLELDDLLEPA